MAVILSDDEIGRPETVEEMIDILKKYDPKMRITCDFDEPFTLKKIDIDPEEGELREYTTWIQIESEF